MSKYVIDGVNKIDGKIKLSTSKNAVLPMMSASLLARGKTVIKKCPLISDVFSMCEILNALGAKTTFSEENLVIDTENLSGYKVEKKLCEKMRSSTYLLSVLLAVYKRAVIYMPGGCEIGNRPIDIHINALKEMGVKFAIDNCEIKAKIIKEIKTASIILPFPSVGASINAITLSCFANGTTVINNVAREPEIVDYCRFLNQMGAKICGEGSSTLIIEGVKRLYPTEYQPIFDRIEAQTYFICALMGKSKIELSGKIDKNILLETEKFSISPCKIVVSNDIIYINNKGRCNCFNVSTGPFPYFSTDLQPQSMALASVSNGISVIKENVFENRFKHVKQLQKMGAKINVFENTAVISGVKRFCGSVVDASDLRGGASLVIAGVFAKGQTVINNTEFIERGYVNMPLKLKQVGVKIKRIE